MNIIFSCSSLHTQSDLGLNIREAHAFNTTDKFSMDVFVVDVMQLEVSGQAIGDRVLSACLSGVAAACDFKLHSYECVQSLHLCECTFIFRASLCSCSI